MAQAVKGWVGLVRSPELGLFLPVLVLPAYLFLGWNELLILAAGLPLLALLLRWVLPPEGPVAVADQVIATLDAALAGPAQGRQTGCLVLQFDTLQAVCDRLGRSRQSEILAASVARIRGALRPGDLLYALEDGCLVIVLAPTERLDLESMVRIAGRLQLVAQQPMQLGPDTVQLTCCIGFCHARQIDGPNGQRLLDAAQVAADEATLSLIHI